MPDVVAAVSPLPPAWFRKDVGQLTTVPHEPFSEDYPNNDVFASYAIGRVGPVSYTIPAGTTSIVSHRLVGSLETHIRDHRNSFTGRSLLPFYTSLRFILMVNFPAVSYPVQLPLFFGRLYEGDYLFPFDVTWDAFGTPTGTYGAGGFFHQDSPGTYTRYVLCDGGEWVGAGGFFYPESSGLVVLSQWDILCRVPSTVSGRVVATVPKHQNVISVAYPNGTDYISRSHLSPQACDPWSQPITIESGAVGNEGILYLPNGRLVGLYEQGSPKVRTNEGQALMDWSASDTLTNAGVHASGLSAKGAFRFVSTGGVVTFYQHQSTEGDDVWYSSIAVASGAIANYVGGVDMGNLYGLLYTRSSDHHILWLTTPNGNDWTINSPVDTGFFGLAVGLTRHPSGALVGLLYQEVDQTSFAVRSFNGGLDWEGDTDPIAAIPALPYPPWLVCKDGILYAIWTTGDTPDMAFSVDTGYTWERCPSSSLAGLSSEVEAILTITGNYTLTDGDRWLFVDATSTNITVTLPLAATIAHFFGVKRIDGSGHTVSVVRSGSDTIDGATSKALATQWEAYQFVPNGVALWGIF